MREEMLDERVKTKEHGRKHGQLPDLLPVEEITILESSELITL